MTNRESVMRESAIRRPEGGSTSSENPPRAGSKPSLDRPLPRGRHGIPPEQIAAHQRTRLRAAVGAALFESGYEALSIREISARAGVSRLTFYKLYADKLDCVLDAQRLALDTLEKRLDAVEPRGTAEIVGALVAFAEGEPVSARLALPCGPTFAAPAFADRALAFHERLAARLEGNRHGPPSVYAEAAAGGLISLIASRIAVGEAASLPDLRPELVELTAAVLGLGGQESIPLAV